LKIEIKYDPDPKSLNHYFPRVTRSETKKETIVADNDCDDPGVSEENDKNPTDDILGDKDKTQLMVQSQKKSNINLFYDLDPESLSCEYCPLLNRTTKRKQSIITVGDDDDTGTPKDTVLAPTYISANKNLTQVRGQSQKNSNIEMCYDSDPESLFHNCRIIKRARRRTVRDNLLSIHKEGKFGAVDQVQDDGFKDINEKIHSVPALKQKHPLLMFKPPYNEAEEIKFTSDYQKVLSAAQVWVPSQPLNAKHRYFDIITNRKHDIVVPGN
jgi:hypothetical protein